MEVNVVDGFPPRSGKVEVKVEEEEEVKDEVKVVADFTRTTTSVGTVVNSDTSLVNVNFRETSSIQE